MRSSLRSLIRSAVVVEATNFLSLCDDCFGVFDCLRSIPLDRHRVEDVVAVRTVGLNYKLRKPSLRRRLLDSYQRVHRLAMRTNRRQSLDVNYRILGEKLQRSGGSFKRIGPPPKNFLVHGAVNPGIEISASSVT